MHQSIQPNPTIHSFFVSFTLFILVPVSIRSLLIFIVPGRLVSIRSHIIVDHGVLLIQRLLLHLLSFICNVCSNDRIW